MVPSLPCSRQGAANIEILYFDTGNLDMLDDIAASALAAEVDVTIDPLFSYPLTKIAPVMAAYNIPVLSLSNNMTAAQTGVWVSSAICLNNS